MRLRLLTFASLLAFLLALRTAGLVHDALRTYKLAEQLRMLSTTRPTDPEWEHTAAAEAKHQANRTLTTAALTASLSAIMFLAALRTARALRQSRRSAQGLCPHCGYNLAHNPTPTCPECGSPY